eukprot:3568428-Prymnesium_polylepis.1
MGETGGALHGALADVLYSPPRTDRSSVPAQGARRNGFGRIAEIGTFRGTFREHACGYIPRARMLDVWKPGVWKLPGHRDGGSLELRRSVLHWRHTG